MPKQGTAPTRSASANRQSLSVCAITRMRTPIQFQQNFPREIAISEAAALAGADPLQFRIDHTKDERVQDHPDPPARRVGVADAAIAVAGGARERLALMRGQGVSIMFRDNGFWACAAHVAVTPETGVVKVERHDYRGGSRVVVNPLQLKRQVQAGSLMGVSQALHEEVTFDEGAITSNNWAAYPILTMAEMPELKVVLAGRPEFGVYGQGSESANALAASAIAAAFFDATGKPVRRLPLRPDLVKRALST